MTTDAPPDGPTAGPPAGPSYGPTAGQSPSPRPSPLTFDDLTADLVWPSLLRAGGLAMRPSRVGLALFAVLLAGFILVVAGGISPDFGRAAGKHASSAVIAEVGLAARPGVIGVAGRLAEAAHALFIRAPGDLLVRFPIATILAALALLAVAPIFGGAISRSAACDFAQGVALSWPEALGFALKRWPSLIGAVLAPLLLAWSLCLMLAVGGWMLFNLPVLNLLGAVLWPLFLVLALMAAVVVVAYAAGHAMLVPAVVCESTDAIDAIQHAYSFIFAKPLRLVAYLGVLLLQGFVMVTLVAAFAALVVITSTATASLWTGDRGLFVLNLASAAELAALGSTYAPSAPDRAARWLVRLFTLLPALIVVAYAVSYYWTAGTLLFLTMRRLCDGQDAHELWMPGMVEGTMAQSSTSGASGTAPAATPAPPRPANDAIADNGPADET